MFIKDEWRLIEKHQLAEQPWLVKQLAGLAEGPGALEERVEILLLLCQLPLNKQAVAISACIDRDKLWEDLLDREEYGAALNLLHSALARWLPDIGEFSDLKWLFSGLLQVKRQAVGKKARVVFNTVSGSQVWESAAMLEALIEDALGAAAEAWVRCLRGPGGGHRVLEIPQALADPDLAESIISELARDPQALTLLLEDVRPQPSDVGLTLEQYVALLESGVEAARYCLDTIMAGITVSSEK
ncbi:hypothetical protein SPSYN_00976 [Sporotomaculum syntrophicum]|uniref:Uncharacterized protein n=1 Tax=Sporotomaculum syntrophicum TaxID=182264 RepID=A0A9D3AYM3_9FIRM|nr:hypothetical protein [Sporotomaculum syntrophicum]KAF1086232.1 hypothetical protein SPSYN_00976 [Sporotomaculum syntrophicum]